MVPTFTLGFFGAASPAAGLAAPALEGLASVSVVSALLELHVMFEHAKSPGKMLLDCVAQNATEMRPEGALARNKTRRLHILARLLGCQR
jgi:hypothetical protein